METDVLSGHTFCPISLYWIVCKAGTLVLRNDSPGFISLESSKRDLTILYLITDVNICLHTNTI